MRKLHVYVAGPLTEGETVDNVAKAIDMGRAILEAGHISFVPHFFYFADKRRSAPYEFWMNVDLYYVAHWADVVVRLPGKSGGADREVALAESLGKYVIPMTVYDTEGSVIEELNSLSVTYSPESARVAERLPVSISVTTKDGKSFDFHDIEKFEMWYGGAR